MVRIATMLMILSCILLFTADIVAQTSVTGGTGVISYNLAQYGRFRVSSAFPYGTRDMDRTSILVGLDKNNVFDYNEDADVVSAPVLLTNVPGVNEVGQAFINNAYSNKPPKVRVKNLVYSWSNASYFVVKYEIINDETTNQNLKVAIFSLPQPAGSYGTETVDYDAIRKKTVYYRSGTPIFWAMSSIGVNPTGVRLLDWDNYSTDPLSEVATDSLRYELMTSTDFNSTLTAGVNGSVIFYNVGEYSFTPGETKSVVFEFGFGTTKDAALNQTDSAAAKWQQFITSVGNTGSVPKTMALHQNYPNPFNPATKISFDLSTRSSAVVKVYDMLGREVAEIFNGIADAGTHTVSFDAANLPTGFYTYTLHANGTSMTKRMMLVK